MPQWYKSDPRNGFNKCGAIIVAMPEGIGYKYHRAYVDIKNAYSILFDSSDIRNCAGQDDWNKDWLWANEPNEYNIETNVTK